MDQALLVAKLKAERPEAWLYLYALVRSRLVSRIHSRLGIDAEEIICDSVSEVWQSLRRLRDDQCFLAYLSTIVRRTAARQATKRFTALSQSFTKNVAAPDPSRNNIEADELLGGLCQRLKKSDLKLFYLLYVTGASSGEIEGRLGIAPEVLWKRKHCLRLKLRRAVEALKLCSPTAR